MSMKFFLKLSIVASALLASLLFYYDGVAKFFVAWFAIEFALLWSAGAYITVHEIFLMNSGAEDKNEVHQQN